MDIAALLKQLQTQASGTGKVSLDSTILTASQTAAIQKTFGLPNGKYLTIDGVTSADVRQAGDSIAIAAGTVDVLNRQALGTTMTFTAGTEVDFVLVVAMPKAWVFADSFPDLTGFPFDLLGLSGCAFLYSTRAVHGYPFWPGVPAGDIDLAAGLNFAADLSIAGLTAMKWLLDSAMPSEPLKLWGPVEAPAPKSFPVMNLSAALGVPALQLVPGLTVTSLRLALQITAPGLDAVQNVVIGVAALTTGPRVRSGIHGRRDRSLRFRAAAAGLLGHARQPRRVHARRGGAAQGNDVQRVPAESALRRLQHD